jgi:hypothetical protein
MLSNYRNRISNSLAEQIFVRYVKVLTCMRELLHLAKDIPSRPTCVRQSRLLASLLAAHNLWICYDELYLYGLLLVQELRKSFDHHTGCQYRLDPIGLHLKFTHTFGSTA